MSKKYKGRIPGHFYWLLQDTVKSEAWKALSHGARSLYAILMRRYNINLQNAVWVSSRDAEEELGRHSNRHNIQLWFRELMHYGFIVMVSPAHHGVNGHGKAPPQTSSLNSRRQAIRFRASHSTETIATIRRGSLP